MTNPPELHGGHLRVFEKLFIHPLPHNLAWKDVSSMLSQLGLLAERDNGHLIFTRNGHTLVIHRPHAKDLADMYELSEIRRFLQNSSTPLDGVKSAGDVLVIIARDEARVFHLNFPAGDVVYSAGEAARFVCYSPNSEAAAAGQHLPSLLTFFESIAGELKDARAIVLFGDGKGKSSEMLTFSNWLAERRPEIARLMVGNLTVDGHHHSDGEMLAQGRRFFHDLAASASSPGG